MRQLLLQSQESKEQERAEKERENDSMQHNELIASRLSDASNVESGLSLNRQ